MIREGFGSRVYNRRKELNLERSYVAKNAGIDYQNLSKIENGIIKCPLGKTASALADVLKTTVSYLVDGIGFPDGQDIFMGNSIPVLQLEEAAEWCNTESKKLSIGEREYIPNPTNYSEKNIFAVKIDNDSMQCSSGRGIPKGCWVIFKPTSQIKTGKFILFSEENSFSPFLREVVIDGNICLRPLNSNYKTKLLTEKTLPIAEAIGMRNLF